jgi:UrcA family protein
MKSLIVMLAVASGYALAAGAPANAAGVLVEQQPVHYTKLELSTPAGMRHVYGRINQAAALVCGNYVSPDILHSGPYQSCLSESVARAVAQIHDERLSRYHELRTNPVSRDIMASSSTGG